MPRPTKERNVEKLPPVNNYKPAGIPLRDLDEVVLTIEEMEAIRLSDVEQLEQAEAAQYLAISTPTYYRILSKAHQKIAEALWNGKALKFEGGNYRLVGCHGKHRFICLACQFQWEIGGGRRRQGHTELICSQCGSSQVQEVR